MVRLNHLVIRRRSFWTTWKRVENRNSNKEKFWFERRAERRREFLSSEEKWRKRKKLKVCRSFHFDELKEKEKISSYVQRVDSKKRKIRFNARRKLFSMFQIFSHLDDFRFLDSRIFLGRRSDFLSSSSRNAATRRTFSIRTISGELDRNSIFDFDRFGFDNFPRRFSRLHGCARSFSDFSNFGKTNFLLSWVNKVVSSIELTIVQTQTQPTEIKSLRLRSVYQCTLLQTDSGLK